MKNLLILGPGRTGKSTLARLFKTQLPNYNLIHTDALRAAIMHDLPARFATELLHYEANDYFVNLLLGFLDQQTKQDYYHQGYILEGSPIFPHHLVKYAHRDHIIPIFLTHGNLTIDQIQNMIRSHDTKQDWSYYLNDHDLHERAQRFHHLNQIIQSECRTYHYDFFDTTKNREQLLHRILEQTLKDLSM